jgi:hypothetical protein
MHLLEFQYPDGHVFETLHGLQGDMPYGGSAFFHVDASAPVDVTA